MDCAPARSALPALEAMAANDPERRVRSTAERTVKTIQEGKPAQVQVAELRKDFKEALEENKDITERLEKLESLLKERGETSGKERAEAQQNKAAAAP